jgi:hypothetical protein
MRWIRSNIRFGSRVALVALGLQIVLSFGHVHLYAVDPHALASVSAGSIADPPEAVSPGTRAPIHKTDGSGDGFCAVCASMQLIAGSLTEAGPALPLPAQLGPIGFQVPVDLVLVPSFRALFNARAPPRI